MTVQITAPRQEGRRHAGQLIVAAALALLAAAVTAWQLSRPGLLFGLTPDVSVYLGGAVRLVHGAVPYRDFVFVQPPGFVLLATPLGWLSELIGTRDALAVLRLCTPLLAAADVAMVGALLRHRGTAAVLAGCAVMALYPAELYAIRGPQLEPVLVFLCLGAALLAFRGDALASPRRLLVAGVLMGLAIAVKQPAVLPVLVLGLLCLAQRVRSVVAFLGGVIAAVAVTVLPFFLLAPAAFLRDTVTTQLGRIPAAGRVPLSSRLAEVTGLSAINAPAAAVLAVSLVLVAVVAAAYAPRRERLTALDKWALLSTAAVAIAQLVPALYYPHYAAFLAPFLSLHLGLCVARLVRGRGRGPAAALASIPLLALLAVALPYVASETVPDVAAAVDAVVPAGGCAISESPVYLVTSDRFQAASATCTTMTDPAGTTLALGDTAAAVATWRSAFSHADYIVTGLAIADWRLPPHAQVPAYVAAHFHAVHAGSLVIYVRNTLATAAPGG